MFKKTLLSSIILLISLPSYAGISSQLIWKPWAPQNKDNTLEKPLLSNSSESDSSESDPSEDEIKLDHSCPKGYVLVPGNPDYSTPTPGKDFCVMKYEASKKRLFGGKRKAVSAKKVPWVWISRSEAEAACEANGPGYHLITNSEWMTLARNIESTPANWSGGRIGKGVIPRGKSNSYVPSAPSHDENPYFGTSYPDDWTHKRTHELSNGEVIWDMAGNVWEWVSDRQTMNQTTEGRDLQEYTSTVHNRDKIQMPSSIADLLRRDGSWRSDGSAGIFPALLFPALLYDFTSDSGTDVGFRCAVALP